MSIDDKQYKAWLQAEPIADETVVRRYSQWFRRIAVDRSAGEVLRTAAEELAAVARMFGVEPEFVEGDAPGVKVRIGTAESADWSAYGLETGRLKALKREGYWIRSADTAEGGGLCIVGGCERGALYGAYQLYRTVGGGEAAPAEWDLMEHPANGLRLINQWDNADGSIERGYAGRSIFYDGGAVRADLGRVRDYARLLASVGINGVAVNNVNVHAVETGWVMGEGIREIARIADTFRPYGIRLYLSVNFAAPMQAGGLATADPLDEGVRSWWRSRAEDIYRHIPDFGGFLVKADSEHRPGPFTYGRDHADGANMLAEALEPFGGLVVWRCFVYNCLQDWRDRSTDRARAAYDHFKPLDGRFKDNVVLQIKNGPMDFQVREPVSPLFGAMSRTNQLIEFQITQEYTGQQRHLCYLVPQWKEALDFDTLAAGKGSEVGKIVDGSLFGLKHSGFAAVSNIGADGNWTGHTLAQSNLYGYGRLAWNAALSAEDIAREWTRLTFGRNERAEETIVGMLLRSWPIYESYTAPLGVGWMVAPNHHYGPDVDGYEYSRWGTYHFADRDGIGVDRTSATGTGYASQYFGDNAKRYESLDECPDELLLFFHHVPYTHKLRSGQTVIQHIYDTHFEGAEEAERLLQDWLGLEGTVDEGRFAQVKGRLEEQASHAKEWRDIINTYFFRKSGIPDDRGRKIYA